MGFFEWIYYYLKKKTPTCRKVGLKLHASCLGNIRFKYERVVDYRSRWPPEQ
jgi:hypothetical protein